MQKFLAQNSYQNNTQVFYETGYNSPIVPAKSQLENTITKIGIVSGMVSSVFILVIAYSVLRMFMIQKEEAEHVDHFTHDYQERIANLEKNPRWQLVEDLVQSNSDADWRVAIIEADVLLEEALELSGFNGASIGEMLTNAGPGSFSTYKIAWDAHKIRNDIAHEGSNYIFGKEDAIKTINMYKSVLEEFGVV